MPKAMRYHANGMKLCVLMYFSSQRTHSHALMNEKARPTVNIGMSATDSSARSL
ncbi:hypothetical protein D3C72_1618580 [compost metagenome]